MDVLDGLQIAASTVTALPQLGWCVLGCVLGLLAGLLPALGPAAVLALLLPAVQPLGLLASVLLMGGVLLAAPAGRALAAVLHRAADDGPALQPAAADGTGHAPLLDVQQLVRQGRGAMAAVLGAAATAIALALGAAVVAVALRPLAALSFGFGPADHLAVLVFGLVVAAVLARGPLLKALAMAVVGLLLGLADAALQTGATGGPWSAALVGHGLSVPAAAVGLLVVADVAARFGQEPAVAAPPAPAAGRGGAMPDRGDWRRAWPAALRGSVLGAAIGLLPGRTAGIAAAAALAIERRRAADRSRFGRGAVEGLAAPVGARQAVAPASLLPLLAFGVPGTASVALLWAVLAAKGLSPGPQLAGEQPQLVWGLVGAVVLAALVLPPLMLVGAPVWRRLLRLPDAWVLLGVLAAACMALAAHGGSGAVLLAALFGCIGQALRKLGCDLGPLIVGLVLAPAIDAHALHALRLGDGHWAALVGTGTSGVLIGAAALLVLAAGLSTVRDRRDRAAQDSG